MENKEIWKDISGYEGHYHVSSLGKIRSLKFGKEKEIKLQSNGQYLHTIFCRNGKRKTFLVHQLVAVAFLNHKPEGSKFVIDHINSNKLDNNIENLRIVSHRENNSKERTTKSGLPVGVRKMGNRFRSSIRIGNTRKNLGSFKTVEEASDSYQKELMKLNTTELKRNKISSE